MEILPRKHRSVDFYHPPEDRRTSESAGDYCSISVKHGSPRQSFFNSTGIVIFDVDVVCVSVFLVFGVVGVWLMKMMLSCIYIYIYLPFGDGLKPLLTIPE